MKKIKKVLAVLLIPAMLLVHFLLLEAASYADGTGHVSVSLGGGAGEVKLTGYTYIGGTRQKDYELGTEITIDAKASCGYHFEGWYRGDVQFDYNNGTLFATESSYRFTVTEETYYLYAKFAHNTETHTITLMGNGHGSEVLGEYEIADCEIVQDYFRPWAMGYEPYDTWYQTVVEDGHTYVVTSYTTDPEGNNYFRVSSSGVTSDKVLYAKWREVEYIDDITINVTPPAAGTSVSGDTMRTQTPHPVISLPDGANYDFYVDTDIVDDEDIASPGYFYYDSNFDGLFVGTMADGETYGIRVYLEPTTALGEFSRNPTIHINGGTLRLYDWSDGSLDILFTAGEQPAQDEIITTASATVVAPTGGEYPSAEVSSGDSSKYSVTFWEWSEGVNPMGPSDQFVEGHDYDVRVIFTANEGYTFDNNTEFTINGETASSWGTTGDRQRTFYNIPAGEAPEAQPTIVHTILVDEGGTYAAVYPVCDPLETDSIGQTMTGSGMWTICPGDEMNLSATVTPGYQFEGYYLTHEVVEQGESTWPDDQLLSTDQYYAFDPADLGTAYPYIKVKFAVNPNYREATQIQIWVSDGGTVSATYTPSTPNVYDIQAKDGTNFVSNGEVVQLYVGDEVTATASANLGYRFVGWRHANVENEGGDKCKGEVFSTESTYTWQPRVTMLEGDEEPLSYICAQFEETSEPTTTYVATLNKYNTDTEELPYGTDLAAYIESKKGNVHVSDEALNAEWLALFVNTGGVYKYPVYLQTVFTGVTYPEDPDCTGISCQGPATFHYRYDYTEVTVTTSNNVTVTLDTNNGEEPTTQTVEANTTMEAPEIPARNGYDFAGWSEDVAIVDENTGAVAGAFFVFENTPITGPTTLVANWRKIHTVHFVVNTGDVTLPDYLQLVDQQVIAGNSISTPLDADGDELVQDWNNYVPDGLYKDQEFTEAYDDAPIIADTNLYVKWYDRLNDYTTISEVNITVVPPMVGTIVTMDGDNWDSQAPELEATVPDGANYTFWADSNFENYAYWVNEKSFNNTAFTGTMVKNGKYYAEIWMRTTDSNTYAFTRDVTVKVNGQAVPAELVMSDLNVLLFIAEITPTATVYHILEGADQTYNTDSKEGLTVSADGTLEKLVAVMVDDQDELGEDQAEIIAGSTIVTLKPEYLATLKSGVHKLSFIYSDGDVSTNFTIENPNLPPDTGIFTAESGSATTVSSLIVITLLTTFGFVFTKQLKEAKNRR